MKLSNNSSFVILIFAILKFWNIDRSTFRRSKFWLPPSSANDLSGLNEDAVSYSTSKKCSQMFTSENLDLENKQRLDQPQKVKDEKFEESLEKNPCRTQSKLTKAISSKIL